MTRRNGSLPRGLAVLAAVVLALAPASPARAGSLGWLDEVVQQIVRESQAGGRATARLETRTARTSTRLFTREANASLESLAKRTDDLARLAGHAEAPAETLLKLRFQRVARPDASMMRAFEALAPAEKRLVVEMGEAASTLAKRYPGQAESIIRRLGVEGLSAVRAYGDDVAEVLVKEGPETVNVLRKSGRAGWQFFQDFVLPNKAKLAAAGVFAAFVANPQLFVDATGRATQFAVEQFARAGVALTRGAAQGLDRALGNALAAAGLNHPALRWSAVALVAFVAFIALLGVLGLPVRWITRPLAWPFHLLFSRFSARKSAVAGGSH